MSGGTDVLTQLEALRRLDRLGVEAFSTRDAAALLGVTAANAHMILKRLGGKDFLVRLARGRWALARTLQRMLLPEHIAAPYPAYLSLHHIPATLFAGFEVTGEGARMASPEKALFDLLYLGPGRSRLFATFRWVEVQRHADLVASPGRQRFIVNRMKALRRPH